MAIYSSYNKSPEVLVTDRQSLLKKLGVDQCTFGQFYLLNIWFGLVSAVKLRFQFGLILLRMYQLDTHC